MARKIKFALEMKDGVKIRSNLEELRENFDLEKAVGHFLSGKLVEWLEDRYYDDEAEKISELDKDSADFRSKLCSALGVEYEGGDELDVAILERLNEKKSFLRQKTDDKSVIDNAAKTALNQEDLSDLLDMGEPTIYLCGESFNIPIRVENKKYIGVLGTPKITIKAESWRDIKAKNITFVNVELADNLCEPKISTPPPPKVIQKVPTPPPPSKPTPPPAPKSLPLHELKKILLESYGAPFTMVRGKDRDYGDLWHIHNSFAFVDERFEKNINGSEKERYLNLICHGRYRKNELIRIGVIRRDEKLYGFALTKDSFCMKGMWLADCVIPYGNILEVKNALAFDDKEIIFSVEKGKEAYINLSLNKSYDPSFDTWTLDQLQKYLNKVKNYYSPEYDKIFLKDIASGGMFSFLRGDRPPWFK